MGTWEVCRIRRHLNILIFVGYILNILTRDKGFIDSEENLREKMEVRDSLSV